MQSTYIIDWCTELRTNVEVPGVIMGVVSKEDDHPLMVGAGNTVNGHKTAGN